MLGSIVLLAAVAEFSAQARPEPKVSFFKAIAAVAIGLVFSCLVLRRKYVVQPAKRLVLEPTDAAALKRWQAGHILHYSMSEAVALYGLVLRYQGFSLSQVLPFYLVGLALMLYGRPRAPK
jgi:hypothetical protein